MIGTITRYPSFGEQLAQELERAGLTHYRLQPKEETDAER